MIDSKRNSLEAFLKSQLIGPNGCRDKYSTTSISKQGEDEILGEVINTTPGSIYSSAILFPKRNPKKDSGDDSTTSEVLDTDEDEQSSPVIDSDKNEDLMDCGDDINSLGRRFPTKVGISCCLNTLDILDDLNIVIRGRYYTKIKDKTSICVKIEDLDTFTSFFQDARSRDLLSPFFTIKGYALCMSKPVSQNALRQYRADLRNLNSSFCSDIANNSDGTKDDIFEHIDPKFRYLSSYKESLFKYLTNVDIEHNYRCFERIDEVRNRIANVEKYETIFSCVEDLLSACDGLGYGFWQAHEFSKKIKFPDIPFNSSLKIFAPEEYPNLKDIVRIKIKDDVYISLDAWIKLYKESTGETYFKFLLINSSTAVQETPDKYFSIVSEMVNERSFFGVQIDISSPYLSQYHHRKEINANDHEAKSLRYLYRDIEDFGVGHLCSVDWGKKEDGLLHVWSEFLPSVETPDVEPIPRDKSCYIVKGNYMVAKPYLDNTECLQFKWLSIFSRTSDNSILNRLLEFVECYNNWISSRRPKGDRIGENNLDKCRKDYDRMKNNIVDFLSEPEKMKAFRLMNTSMFIQLWHSKNCAKVLKDQKPTSFEYYRDEADENSIFPGQKVAWRPFQLAFILLNLDGIYRRKNDTLWYERNELVDLVWFPTGGGKTEAYLGLIALTIINRRFIHPLDDNGVTAFMRYTLRLLTTQQFQRAMRLILALEQIRLWGKENYDLGQKPISIGLYVGQSSLPNREDELITEVANWESTHGRIPLDTCPWCGSPIDICKNANREQAFKCKNRKCTFGGRQNYPVRLCDEYIYKDPPTLLFGTVDKFAQLAHKVDSKESGDSRRLFCAGLSPDLIIQDELHLLLGPLGSAVGLFECAVDQLCTRNENGLKVRPKIISSTATTRNTSLQIRALYDRAVSIFPKNGIDYDDSFFAFYKRFKVKGQEECTFLSKRKYLGVLPTGRTQMTTQIRLAAILFVHRALFELENLDKLTDEEYIKTADYYYSVISYFNSLKEVGKTDAQFYREFNKYTGRLFKRVLRYSNMLECFYAYKEHFRKSELTGRLSGSEAVHELEIAQNLSWNPSHRLPFKQNDKWVRPILPADFILATNMISVGLDVARFNTIIINSMPRNISEYIQATSRVAREEKGLVITLHNPFRQRDVSHFEKFKEFHEKLYYYVDPISITPFSPKSIDKFLPLYMAALIRHKYPQFSGRKDACKIDYNEAELLKKELKVYFDKRYERSKSLSLLEKGLLTEEMLMKIKEQIDVNIDTWVKAKTEVGNRLAYYLSLNNKDDRYPLFASPEDFEGEVPENKWLVPNSLRVIEPEAVIHINK